MTQVRIPRTAPRYGKRTRAHAVYTSGGTFSGRRTRSRYGYTQGSYWLVRSDGALRIVYAAKIARTLGHLKRPLAENVRYTPSASNGPELKPSTRTLNAVTYPNSRQKAMRRARNVIARANRKPSYLILPRISGPITRVRLIAVARFGNSAQTGQYSGRVPKSKYPEIAELGFKLKKIRPNARF